MARALAEARGTSLERAGDGFRTGMPLFEPRADIMETGEAFLLQIEVPAVRPEDLDVTVERNVLTVRGRASDIETEGMTPLYSEFESGLFERVFRLSEDIDQDRIEARHRDGLLALVLPKKADVRARHIAINKA
ncbi:MAG: Hsp20/alpha crystallin family protein [Rhodothalassiaceae bacterium]